jgi:hypothetical protein
MDIMGILSGLPGEIHIHGVLGEDRHEGQKGNGQRLWNLKLGELRPPGEDVRGPKNRKPRGDGIPGRREMGTGDFKIDPLKTQQENADDETEVSKFRHRDGSFTIAQEMTSGIPESR